MPVTLSARELATRLGLHRSGREWRGNCPSCRYSDTFMLTERGGRVLAWCASCQDQGFVTHLLRGGDCAEARATQATHAAEEARSREWKRERALDLWRGSRPASGTPADVYLKTRGLASLAASRLLRFSSDCPHPGGGRLPALIALVTDGDDWPLGIQRIFVRPDGTAKADVEPQRASLGPVWGGVVRLDPIAPEIVIGEGIESSASAGRLLRVPAWAAISAGNLARGVKPPPEVRKVWIAVDNDPPGRKAARAAYFRFQAEGRVVRCATPHSDGLDFNDVLMNQLEKQAVQPTREAT